MDTLKNDVVYAIRSLARSPGLSLAAVLCLALGIGATTTMYSATRAIVLKPVPVRDSERVVRVSELPPNSPPTTNGVSAGTLAEWKNVRAFRQVGGFTRAEVSLTGTTDPERVTANRVTPSFFSILSGRALLGRTLLESDVDAGRQHVVVLGYALWQRRGADREIIGKTMLIDGTSHEIVGVMPREFVFPPAAELWLPLSLSPDALLDRGGNFINALAMLRPGYSVARANAEVNALQRTVEQRFPQVRADWTAVVEPIQHFYGRQSRPYMLAALGSVSLVLLIACANVANLLLARASGRQRELAVRTAMGASRGRIISLLLTESAVLALIGGAAGIMIALWGVLLFRNSIPAELVKFNPGWTEIRVNGPTLLFALVVAVGSSLLFGVLPALQAARDSLQGNLREGGRGTVGMSSGNRTRNALVVIEVALALMLVVSTGLMLRNFKTLLDTPPGFQRENILTMQLALPPEKYDTGERINGFYDALHERLLTVPGVLSAGFVNVLPMDWNDTETRVTDDAHAAAPERDQPIIRVRTVSDDYFRTLQIPLRSGRHFDDRLDGLKVAIVSERLARQLAPDGRILGKRVQLLGDTAWLEIIGVVADTRHNPNVGEAIQPTLHLPLRQKPLRRNAIVLRTAGEPADVAAAAQHAISSLDPGLAAGDVRSLEKVIHNALSPQRGSAGMAGIFGTVALVLACVGVYGVMSYSVARRAAEMGVRVALGARNTDVLRLVMQNGARITGLGVVIGLGGALALSRAMQSLMKDAAQFDTLTFAASTALLILTALFATYIPARRAAATDPTLLLRRE
jgi:putative ABC transport system permease protein